MKWEHVQTNLFFHQKVLHLPSGRSIGGAGVLESDGHVLADILGQICGGGSEVPVGTIRPLVEVQFRPCGRGDISIVIGRNHHCQGTLWRTKVDSLFKR